MPPRSYGGQLSPGQFAAASDGEDAGDDVIAVTVGSAGGLDREQAQRVSASAASATADALMGLSVRAGRLSAAPGFG
jgi:hypothetical protein